MNTDLQRAFCAGARYQRFMDTGHELDDHERRTVAVQADAYVAALPGVLANSEPPPTEQCSECHWSNVNLMNLGEPNKPRWVCHRCCKLAIEQRDRLAALASLP